MRDLLRFEIWQVCLLENLCDACLRMHGRVKIAVLFKNWSRRQVAIGTCILLSCILALRYRKDIIFIFFFSNFQFFYFHMHE